MIDTGCSTNIINLATYQYLKRSTKIQLKTTKVSLVTYGATKESTNLKTLGTIHCLAESNDRLAEDVLFVVNTTAINLIGENLALRLNLLTLNVHLVSTKEVPVATQTYNYKNKIPKHLHSHVQKYKKVFQGIGRFNGDKIKLHINKTIKPVAQKPRRVPFNLRQKVEQELETLRKEDIIEDIQGEPTPWISPIVIVPKKYDADQVRLCIDMRQANKAIERMRYPLPSFEDLIHDLNGSKLFCKLDMNKAFLQFELDEDSRYITTFASHEGLHRFKRLNFGTTSASEELQMKIEQILHGIPNCRNIGDDIILYGTNAAELDKEFISVLKRFAEYNLTLNIQKCEF